ncbi:transglutaminase family protein [bacterium]|nr:transglutaminase family protein [bacterium]
MRYKITHTTTYSYTETVPICHNEVRLSPRDGRLQSCSNHRLAIKPKPEMCTRRGDYFGNGTHHFSILEGHKRLTVRAVSRVEVRQPQHPAPESTTPWESIRDLVQQASTPLTLDAYQFVFDSPSVALLAQTKEYAAESFPPQRPILEGVIDLTKRIHSDFQYDPKATTVTTPVDEVFDLRRGVCQDFAHLQISGLRGLGIPARYVSGYLRTIPPAGRPRLVGADASHAWLSVFCGEAGWIDVDPTNNCLVSTDHITVAWGRDYSDVCPIKGVFIGGGTHKMTVSVDVLPLDQPAVATAK